MLDLMSAPGSSESSLARAAPATPPPRLAGGHPVGAWAFARMLDVVDYGMLLLVDETHVTYANQTALAEMDDSHPLQWLGRELRARNPHDAAALRQALGNALQRRVQTLLTLGRLGGDALSVSVVPLAEPGETPAALLIFGRRGARDGLSTDAFARQHRLTEAETRVLKLLCSGSRPADIAAANGVCVSTVRTQVGSIRAKVGTRDVGGIMRRVARLPPLPCVLRSSVR
jgi:DNA-binding CsgD family transcriptional regulator